MSTTDSLQTDSSQNSSRQSDSSQNSSLQSDSLQRELDIIEAVENKGALEKFVAYAKLSGPGWMQGAITLGGGSLAGALYLGVISGYGLMWLQPLAMICGIIMLCAIAYVTLSTGNRPFGLVNQHLSPLLGWSWLIGTIMANMVWCMPQFALATGSIQQNLFSESIPTIAIVATLLAIGFFINFLYESGGRRVKLFDLIIKIMVGIIVLSFFAVVVTLTANGALSWGRILAGFVPDFSLLFNPAPAYSDLIARSSDPAWWTNKIANDQKNIIFTAFGTAVGINMTWLLPYTLLKKRWGAKHRGLSVVDLSIGLFIPFFLATSCVVIAAASQFHTRTNDVLTPGGQAFGKSAGEWEKTLLSLPAMKQRAASLPPTADGGPNEATKAALMNLPQADRQLAAMLVKRDSFALANTLQPLAGETVSQKIFGIGVLGMALSTIIILMLMNGIAFQELFHAPGNKTIYFLGCAVSGFSGAAGPFFWKGAAPYLAVPTSVIGGALIPIAYFTFLLLMNSRKVLGDQLPRGNARIIWNVMMLFATSVATFGSIWAIKDQSIGTVPVGKIGIAFFIILFVVGITSFLKREKQP
jgi:Mn2+/Fe2+ NRAMP family transporter